MVKTIKLIFSGMALLLYNCITNVTEVTNETTISCESAKIKYISLDRNFISENLQIDTIQDDSIKILIKSKRRAVKNDTENDLDFRLATDSSGKSSLTVSAEKSSNWPFYIGHYFETKIKGPSKLGIELYGMFMDYPYSLRGFKGFHHIVAFDSGSIKLETVSGCLIETNIDSVTVEIIFDSTGFNSVTIKDLPDSLKRYRPYKTSYFPETVRLIIPPRFSSWLKCTMTTDSGKIQIDSTIFSNSIFEGPLNNGQPHIREISLFASNLIQVIYKNL